MRTIARFGIRFFRFNESESSLPDTDALAARRVQPVKRNEHQELSI